MLRTVTAGDLGDLGRLLSSRGRGRGEEKRGGVRLDEPGCFHPARALPASMARRLACDSLSACLAGQGRVLSGRPLWGGDAQAQGSIQLGVAPRGGEALGYRRTKKEEWEFSGGL